MVFDSEIFDWGDFLSRNPIFCDWKWSDWASETQIEPSCDRIGLELSSVDQKVFMIVIWLFSDSRFFIFCNRYMVILGPRRQFPWVSTWDRLGALIRSSNQGTGKYRSGLGGILEFSCHQVRNILSPNHVSGGIHSGLHFEKAFNRDRFLKGLTPKYQVLESRPLITKKKINQCPKPIKDRRNRTKNWVLWDKIVQPQILSFLEKS